MENKRLSFRESQVNTYCNSFPGTYARAEGSFLETISGKRYLDFLSGCGTLNYGHNNQRLRIDLIDYLEQGGISMSLDLETDSKNRFVDIFHSHIMRPRGFDYCLQFPGPTGTNAVEAAVKLARKYTARTNVVAFTNAFHGCTQGALSMTGSRHHRSTSGPLLNQVSRFPYDNYFGSEVDTAEYIRCMLSDPSAGIDPPAAIILEVIQGEGGLNVASKKWLRSIQKIASDHGALFIVDDIQAGCGRRGSFFSFESYGVIPDIVLLSKSLSGFGQPLSMLMIKTELDIWEPGEHNGTFRGNNLAFVTGTTALDAYWSDQQLENDVHRKSGIVRKALEHLVDNYGFVRKGDGLMQGLEVNSNDLSMRIREICFEKSLILEACGPEDSVLKLMPPLTIEDDHLELGLDILDGSIKQAVTVKTCLSVGKLSRKKESHKKEKECAL